MSDMKKEVDARAAEIEAKAMAKKQQATSDEQHLDKNFVLDCMCRNTVGDAMLFRELFRGKYVFVQEWKKFLVWKKHYWEVDLLAKKPLADAERLCEAYQNAWIQTNEEEGTPLHKTLEKKLRSLRSARGRKDMLECVTTI